MIIHYFDTLEVLDLTGLINLKNYTSYYGQLEIKLKGDFENVTVYWTGPVDFSVGSTSKNVLLGGMYQYNYSGQRTLYFQKMFKGLKNCSHLDYVEFQRIENINFITDGKENGSVIWNGSNTKHLMFRGSWYMIPPVFPMNLTGFGIFNGVEELEFYGLNNGTDDIFETVLSELSEFTGLECLSVCNCRIESKDLKSLSSLQNLKYLDLRYNKITDISFLKNLTNLKDLLLGSNQISSLWPLENLTHLGEAYEKDSSGNDVYGRLDLSNNPLSDVRGTYIDENGTEREYYNMRILANLNVNKDGKLRRLFLEGCSNITENGLNVLRDSSLSWMNKSGF